MNEVMSADVARSKIDSVRRSIEETIEMIRQLWDGRAWISLGYGTWEELIAVEIRPVFAIAKADRDGVMVELTAAGLPTRAVAAVVDVDQATVVRHVPRDASASRKVAAIDDPEVRAKILDLLDRGAYRREIAEETGIASSHVGTIITALGRRLRDRPRTYPYPPAATSIVRVPKPTVVATPTARTVPRHRMAAGAFARIANFREHFDERRFALGVCFEVDSAVADADEEWLDEYRRVVSSLRDDFARLLRIAEDPAFRDAQSRVGDGSPPSAVPTRLRSVP